MKSIPLTKGKIALIDDEDFWRVMQYKWYCMTDGGGYYYAYNEEVTFMHRFILNTNSPVDHKDRDTLNNQKANLRICTYSENQANRAKTTTRKTVSKYKGVRINNGRWSARIYKEYKEYSLGSFDNEEDAARAYNEKALELYGEFALLNVIE